MDLIDATSKSWRVDLIQTLFTPPSAKAILNTPLFNVIDKDLRIWAQESSGCYSVRSAYKLLIDRVLDTSHLKVAGNWRQLWKLKIPPRVKHFIWRLCRHILPTRSNLAHRHIVTDLDYPFCPGNIETKQHTFIHCTKASACMVALGMNQMINDSIRSMFSFVMFSSLFWRC